MRSQEIFSILVRIILLFAMGAYLLKNRDRAFPGVFNRDRYDPKKVATLLAFGLFGIGIACIPSLLSLIFQKMWLNIFSRKVLE